MYARIGALFIISPLLQLVFWAAIVYLLGYQIPLGVVLLSQVLPASRERNRMCIAPWKFFLKSLQRELLTQMEVIASEEFEKLQGKPAIVAYGPHGITPTSQYFLFEKYPQVVLHAASTVLWNPITRILLVFARGGIVSVSRNSVEKTLSENKMALIFPGGIQEIMATEEPHLYMQHKGFIRLAREKNVPVIPVYAHNERKLWRDLSPRLTNWCYRYLKVPLISTWFGSKSKVTIYIGEPLYPKDYSSVEQMHQQYYRQMLAHHASC